MIVYQSQGPFFCEAEDPETLTNQSRLGFFRGGFKETGAKTEHFRQRVNAGIFRQTV